MIALHGGTLHEIGKDFTPDIEVIAFALSHINRFTGHVGPYSVAQHCVLTSRAIFDQHFALDALLHDAPEAYIGDVSAPLKHHLPEYRKLEDHYHGVIDRHFKVGTRRPAVREADLRMLVTEAMLFGLPLGNFPVVAPYHALTVDAWPPVRARGAFLERFRELTK